MRDRHKQTVKADRKKSKPTEKRPLPKKLATGSRVSVRKNA